MSDQKNIDYSDSPLNGPLAKLSPARRRGVLDDIIADGLTKIRVNKGLQQNELAKLLGIKPQMVSRYERKESIVPFGLAYEMASKLGVPLDSFFADLKQNANQYVLSDNQQAMIDDYFENNANAEKDLEKLRQAYFSITDPAKRANFMSVVENVVKSYKD